MIAYVTIFGGPASGKRSVGQALAQRLGWRFVDFDEALQKHAGRPVGRLLQELSKDSIHDLTRAVADEIADEPEAVIAFDGRWPANLTAVERLRPGALSVWLSASPSEAVRRMRGSDRAHRLLEQPNPVDATATVLKDREPQRRRVDLRLLTDGLTVEEVAFTVEQLVRTRRG